MVVQIFNSSIVSGPETLVLPALRFFRERHMVIFLVEKRKGEKGREPVEYARKFGLGVEEVEVGSRLDFTAIGRLRALLERHKPRLVHAHDVKATTYAWLAARRSGCPILSTHHGVLGRPDWKTRIYEIFYARFILPKMQAVIAVSEPDFQLLLERGIQKKILHYVPNGATCRLWQGEERERERCRIRADWSAKIPGLTSSTILLGMVARLSAEKRHSYFLKALSFFRIANPNLDWRFLVIGSGALESSLRAEGERLGIGERCIWLGYQENAAALLPGLDLVALPSWAEGLPITAIEAGWAGTPLFASAVGDLPKLIGSNTNAGGLVFPREQAPELTACALASVLARPEQLRAMGKALQNRVAREYSSEAWVNRMESVYQAV